MNLTYEQGIAKGEANLREYKILVRKLQKENEELSSGVYMWRRRALKAERTPYKKVSEFIKWRIMFNVFGVVPKDTNW